MDCNESDEHVRSGGEEGVSAGLTSGGFLPPRFRLDDETRCSTDTIRSLDISNNIPRIVFSMDAEDSPWGGMYSPKASHAKYSTPDKSQMYPPGQARTPIFQKLQNPKNKVSPSRSVCVFS